MKLGQPLIEAHRIRQRFGELTRLALGKNAIGVIFDAGNDRYRMLELFVSPPKGAAIEKVKLKPADHTRITTNTQRIHEAIKRKKNLIVLYQGSGGVKRYSLLPLDVTPGKTERTRENQYLWLYSKQHKTVLSMRMDRVLWTKVSNESFDPAEVMGAIWKDKRPTWILRRKW